jgi:hypothetical protein
MTETSQNTESKRWMPVTAGILCLVGGILAIFVGLAMWRRHEVIGLLAGGASWRVHGLFAVIMGLMSIIGGVFAIVRKAWGAAFAGAITALYPFGVFGILAIIFVSMAKSEFNPKPVNETIILEDKTPKS